MTASLGNAFHSFTGHAQDSDCLLTSIIYSSLCLVDRLLDCPLITSPVTAEEMLYLKASLLLRQLERVCLPCQRRRAPVGSPFSTGSHPDVRLNYSVRGFSGNSDDCTHTATRTRERQQRCQCHQA